MKNLLNKLLKSGRVGLCSLTIILAGASLNGAGLLESTHGSAAIRLMDHSVKVEVRETYARTEVSQTFVNTSQNDLEAVYSFPLPKGATLSQLRIIRGEDVQSGEVVEKSRGEAIYEKRSSQGEKAGFGVQESYQRYRFNIYPVPAMSETRMEVVYYETLNVDTGIGVYRYPLEDNGTDESVPAFWATRDLVEGKFSIEVDVSSAWPLADIRAPEHVGTVQKTKSGWTYQYESPSASLNKDFILYYRFEDNLPGRIDVMTYKANENALGTFMAVVTPGMDLKPLEGSDTVFILDISGSMQSKFGMLAAGVEGAIRRLGESDRMRVVLFNDQAFEITNGWTEVNKESVPHVLNQLQNVNSNGGTNLFAGLRLGLDDLSNDRMTNVVFVTDGVANLGELNPRVIEKYLSRKDIRMFAFVMGNGANWPLMETICEATGGYSRGVSNSQDIIGEILLAQGKIGYEALHNAKFTVSGSAGAFDITGKRPGKLFRGEQVVLFGRYKNSGSLKIDLSGLKTGVSQTYEINLQVLGANGDNPELERLWALARMKELNESNEGEAMDAALDLAMEYQFVTEQTAMLVLDDAAFDEEGIERRNLKRTQEEQLAQSSRSNIQPASSQPATHQQYQGNSPSVMGGAFSWEFLLFLPLAFIPMVVELSKFSKVRK